MVVPSLVPCPGRRLDTYPTAGARRGTAAKPHKARDDLSSGSAFRYLRRYPGAVADGPKVITAEELDAMSPDERARVVREHIVTELDQLPDGFRRRVERTAARLAQQRGTATE